MFQSQFLAGSVVDAVVLSVLLGSFVDALRSGGDAAAAADDAANDAECKDNKDNHHDGHGCAHSIANCVPVDDRLTYTICAHTAVAVVGQ